MRTQFYHTKKEAHQAASNLLARMIDNPRIVDVRGYLVTGKLGSGEDACIFTYQED